MRLRIVRKGEYYVLQQKKGYSILSYWRIIFKHPLLSKVQKANEFIKKSL